MEQNFNKGDVLCVNRGLYSHYGVYAGNGEVIHFTSDNGDGTSEINPLNADVVKTDFEAFSKGDEVTVDNQENPVFSGDDIVYRAESLIGSQKGKYDLAVNNCEHFAKWCKTGQKISDQVEVVKEIIPKGKVIHETYSQVKETVEKIRDIFENETPEKSKTFSRIEKRTKEILDDYNNKDENESTETWIGKTFQKVNPLHAGAEFVKDYINDVNAELDINDSYRKAYEDAVDGMVWFKKGTSKESIYADKDLQRLPIGEQGELYVNSAQADFYGDLVNNLEKEPLKTAKNFLENIDINDELGKRNAKIVLATGMKIAGSAILHFEVPNSVTVPLASAGVEIGCVTKACLRGEVSVGKCTAKIAKEVAVAGYHIIKRAPESFKEFALSAVGKATSKITGSVAGKTYKNAMSAEKTAVTSTIATAKKTFAEKAGKIIAKVGAKTVSIGKKILGKLFG